MGDEALDGTHPIDHAREIVGPSAPDDYIIQPTEHAERYRGSAPALAKLLRAERAIRTARQYEESDAKVHGLELNA